MSFLNTILEIVFPVYCVSCGKRSAYFCSECLSDAPEAEQDSHRKIADWIYPSFDYRHPPIKKAIWLIKYKGRKRLVRVFAEILHGRILEELSELSVMQNFREPILVPIPLSKKRHKERGFNQAELLCREIINLTPSAKASTPLHRNLPMERGWGEGIPLTRGNERVVFSLLTNILIKIKETDHQARIRDRRKRLENIVGSFAIKNPKENLSLIRNRNIILIDDVTTTSATLAEAKKILKQAGARKVIAFTIAH